MLGKLLVGSLVSHQATVLVLAEVDRKAKYAAAVEVSETLVKPMLVVGGPWGQSPWRALFGLKAHGCGDQCLDLDPIACNGCDFMPGDVRALPFERREFGAVFNSHVLEHLPSIDDCAQAWRELHRVADYVFTCLPSKRDVVAWLAPGHHLWVSERGPGVLRVQERGSGRRATVGIERSN